MTGSAGAPLGNVPPMATKKARPASEDRLVRLLQQRYSAKNPLIKKGIGDDAAVILPRGATEYWLITTDMLVEEIDFRRDWTSARLLGRKSMAVNLSDLAAMGAIPRFYTVSLAVTPDIPERWIMDFHDGLTEKAKTYGADLIGGDLSGVKAHLAISVTAFGESHKRKVVYRSGGKPGDLVYVTGILGRSAAGLALLQKSQGRNIRGRHRLEALRAHRDPDPRCEAGLWLSQSGLVSSMMDLSDGLSSDLPRICAASGVGAEIVMTDLPFFRESASWGCDPVQLALHGGEDYELLFVVPASNRSRLEKTYPAKFSPITCIGRLIAEKEKIWMAAPNGERLGPLPRSGWDHFRKLRN